MIYADEVAQAHMRVRLKSADGTGLNAIAFRAVGQKLGAALVQNRGRLVHAAGSFALDRWQGEERVQFRLTDPEPLLFHNEALVRDGVIVGPVTSGNYGHFLGGAIGLGYVPCKGQSDAEILCSHYEIEVAGVRHAAVASLAAMYDPKSERVRA